MKAGPLRHRITIQTLPDPDLIETDDAGQPIEDWTTFIADVPASIRPLSGRELLAAAAINSEVTTRICTRYIAGLEDSRKRIVHPTTCCGIAADVYYDVLFPNDVDMAHREFEFLCSSGLRDVGG